MTVEEWVERRKIDKRNFMDEVIADLASCERERDRLQHIIDCANTPLMRDVMAERDEYKRKARLLREALVRARDFVDADDMTEQMYEREINAALRETEDLEEK